MKHAQELLNILRQGGAETRQIEAKRLSGVSAETQSVFQTICAFANEPGLGGGWLLLGVEENRDAAEPFRVVGIQDVDKVQNDLLNACRSDKFTMYLTPDCEQAILEDKVVLVLRVHEAESIHKPVKVKSKNGLEAWRRSSNGDRRCTQEDERELIRESANTTFDEAINHRARMHDLDFAAVERFRNLLKIHRKTSSCLEYDAEELLFSYSCIAEEHGQTRPTHAGILLFGLPVAIQRLFPMFSVDYILCTGTTWVDDAHTPYQASKDYRENIFTLAERLPKDVLSELPVRPVFRKNDIQRHDEPWLPDRALREAIINLLMHQDYQKNSPAQIRKYADRLELENPGYSLKPLDKRFTPTSSPRNPAIARVFHDVHFAENHGTGFRVMQDAMKKARLKDPLFVSDSEKNTFSVTFLRHHMLDHASREWLMQLQQFDLTENNIAALMHIYECGSITNMEYCQTNSLGADDKKARRELAQLCDKGLLQQRGSRRGTRYIIAQGLEPDRRSKQLPLSSTLTDESLRGQPSKLETQLSKQHRKHPAITSQSTDERMIIETQKNVEQPNITQDYGSHFSHELEKQLGNQPNKHPFITPLSPPDEVALTSAQRHSNAEARDALAAAVCALCADTPQSAKTLARAFGMSIPTLKKHYLGPLVDAGTLALVYPDTPKHPRQAYILPKHTDDDDQR